MTGDTWFSSRLRFAIIIETLGPVRYDDSVYLLRSTDFEAAFQRALETGRKNQKEYLNGDGQKVNATRFSNPGNRLRQLWGSPPGLRGPPGPAFRATEPAISAHEEADVDVGRRTGVPPYQ